MFAVAYFLRHMDPSVGVVVVERDPRYTVASTARASGGVGQLLSLPENIELSNYSIPFFEAFAEAMPSTARPPTSGSSNRAILALLRY